MKCRFLLNVVVGECAAVLELLAGEDETLLVWWDTLLVLDLGLDVVDGIRALDLKSDGLAGQGLDKDLHTTTKAEDEMKGALLLDVVVGEGAAIFELLARENETLLVRGNALLVLDLGLDVVCPFLSAPIPFPRSPLFKLYVRCVVLRSSIDQGYGCVPMVSEDSTSRVIVLPVTAVALAWFQQIHRWDATYGSSRRSACLLCCGILVSKFVG